MNHTSIRVFEDEQELAQHAAALWLQRLGQNPHHVALSGGRIAGTLFREIARQAADHPDRLRPVHFWWADERCVPPDDLDSNYRLARENLLDPLEIPPARVHRLQGELSPAEAVVSANATAAELLPKSAAGNALLDQVFLGMGEDGHVASLFPGPFPPGPEAKSTYTATTGPKPPPRRISLTYPTLIAASEVWVLISGRGKLNALEESLRTDGNTPLARVLNGRRSSLVLRTRTL